jgi:hypothetical protein
MRCALQDLPAQVWFLLQDEPGELGCVVAQGVLKWKLELLLGSWPLALGFDGVSSARTGACSTCSLTAEHIAQSGSLQVLSSETI